jgi:hypothetical protein
MTVTYSPSALHPAGRQTKPAFYGPTRPEVAVAGVNGRSYSTASPADFDLDAPELSQPGFK